MDGASEGVGPENRSCSCVAERFPAMKRKERCLERSTDKNYSHFRPKGGRLPRRDLDAVPSTRVSLPGKTGASCPDRQHQYLKVTPSVTVLGVVPSSRRP